jgi:hypothetical protein
MADQLKFKKPGLGATWTLFKVINNLQLARIYGLIWNIYPAMDFIDRNHHA